MAQILEGIEGDDILNRPLPMIILVIVALMSVNAVSPVSAIVPTVQKVVPYDVGGSTYLNITVQHTPQDPTIPHYVDMIKVTMGTNTTQLNINSISVSPPNNNFTVTYDLGPISGTPSITVDAHCLVNGWASSAFPNQAWTGTVPEFSLPMLLLVMIAVLSIAVFISRKARPKTR